MDIVKKDALGQVRPGADDADSPNGSFEIVLSTGTKDRDGEEVKPEEWELPLPAKIGMDKDHAMSVDGTVGSGVPSIEDGKLIVRGTYASDPESQKVRSKVNEGHVFQTSVAFLRKHGTDAKSGKSKVTRELLNGAFVAIPANPEAVVLSSKTGARNNAQDAKDIQAIHDKTAQLGATCVGQEKSVKSVSEAPWDGGAGRFSIDQWKASCLIGPLGDPNSKGSYKLPVLEPNGDVSRAGCHAAAAALDGAHGNPLDAPGPEKKAAAKKLTSLYRSQLKEDPPPALLALAGAKAFLPQRVQKDHDPMALIGAIDAAIDEACNQLDNVDIESLPLPVQQALALVTAAGVTVGQLMQCLGILDPDKVQDQSDDDSQPYDGPTESDDSEDDEPRPAAADKSAAATASESASELENKLRAIKAMAAIYGQES